MDEDEGTFIQNCIRKGMRIHGVNKILLDIGLTEITITKYEWYARNLSKHNLMEQRNIDAIAWQGKGR